MADTPKNHQGDQFAILLDQAREVYGQGDLSAAARLCREALKLDSNNWEFQQLMAAALSDAGLFSQALPFMLQCLAQRGADSAVLFNYGVILRGLDRFGEAARAFRHAAEASPKRADCWFNLGETLARMERLGEALEALSEAVRLEPENADAWFNLGNVNRDLGRIDEALEAYGKAAASAPDQAGPLNNMGLVFIEAGRGEDAINAFRAAINADETSAAAFDNLGNALAATGDGDGAIAAFQNALRLVPDYADAHYNLASYRLRQGDFVGAERGFRQALKSQPAHLDAWLKAALCRQSMGDAAAAAKELQSALGRWPGNAAILGQLGNVLRDLGEFGQARAMFEAGLAGSPGNQALMVNFALALQHEGKLDEAIKTYQLALDVAPGDMNLHLNLAHALLISGRMEEGWAEFEHRLADPAIAAIIENAPGKDWHGEPLDGQSILLLCEQGLGDAIQFCRAIPELKSKGAEVHLAGPARMERLMSSIEGLAGFHAAGGAMPKTDFHCPLVSLSHRAKYAIQVSAQAYLTAEPERVALWAARLEHPEGPKIGIAWQGNSAYGTDYARSIPLKQLARLTGRTDAHFVVLQHGPGRDQLPALAGEIPLIDFGDDVDGDAAFVDTAAIMANLDLIITSDTAIPHLAAALGRPVWMLLPFAPDWRWLLDRSDSPHYASMRLFRQTSPMDWGSALDQARRSLDLWLGSGGDPNAAADQMLGGG